MEQFLREHRPAFLGTGVVLMFAPLVGAVVVGWEPVMTVLGVIGVVLSSLLVLKAASVFFVIVVRSLL